MKSVFKYLILISFFSFPGKKASAQSIVTTGSANAFDISNARIYVDSTEPALLKKIALLLQGDIALTTGKQIPISYEALKPAKNVIIIGTTGSFYFKTLQQKGLIKNNKPLAWEEYLLQTVSLAPIGIENALMIIGSDRRGTAFGVFELSKQIGVSPWYWWADVPVQKRQAIFIKKNSVVSDAPKVKYRGIFINDEAPALSNWSKATFGGFTHSFYEKVFELMLRLKANYIWPAMWGNAFYDDDSLNIQAADEYGIVIGTSHHEPLMRAHDEWRRYGNKQKWNYDSTAKGLQEFWRGGMRRAWNEKIVSVGMRGDGDEPMSRETATALLEKIVTDQRKIIQEVTGKAAEQTPQLWALYKEVQDYYDKGMRVPDDVTLLLCDDNWGNLRKLPKPSEARRKGGYGIYYHFDYVGGPRNYKWLNTNPLPRVWEQMHLAWHHNVRDIWIVNVGDIKPMELPISFFLDYAWNPEKIQAKDIHPYSQQWASQQFGNAHAAAIADILAKYTKYNSRRKPELLDAKTFNLESGEWERVAVEYKSLQHKTDSIAKLISPAFQNAYLQLVAHPVRACANLYQLYYAVALNQYYASEKNNMANRFGDMAKEYFMHDSLLTNTFHESNNRKWNHMMSQTHIGYTYWQQPQVNKMPEVKYINNDSALPERTKAWTAPKSAKMLAPNNPKANVFFELDNYVSIAANNFTRQIAGNGIRWKILPDHGRTGDAITTLPVTTSLRAPSVGSPQLQYDIYTYSSGKATLALYFSPTLNIYNNPNGLRYAVSIDDETPQVVSLNKEDTTSINGIWNKWVAENIIIKKTYHTLDRPGKHTVKYWMVDNAVVLQKIIVDCGIHQQDYLGQPETRMQ